MLYTTQTHTMSVFMNCSDAFMPFGVVFRVLHTHTHIQRLKRGLVEHHFVSSLKTVSCPLNQSSKNKLIDTSRFSISTGNTWWFKCIAIDYDVKMGSFVLSRWRVFSVFAAVGMRWKWNLNRWKIIYPCQRDTESCHHRGWLRCEAVVADTGSLQLDLC